MTDRQTVRKTVSRTPAVRQDLAPMQSKMDYAKVLATAKMLPKQYQDNPANVLWAIEFGEMVGLSPMAAITSVHVIEGKPTASAQLIAALIRKAGHKLRVHADPQRAVAQIVRKDDPDHVFRAEWTLDRARAAGLAGKDNWRKHAQQMLAARAITEVGRMACSDVLLGMAYSTDELTDFGDGVFVVDAEPSPEPKPETEVTPEFASKIRTYKGRVSTPEPTHDPVTGEIEDDGGWPDPAPIPNGDVLPMNGDEDQ